MKNKCNLDERQLWIRGEIYKHMVIYMGGLLLLNAFLTDYGIVWAEGMYSSLIILFISLMAGVTEMFLRDVYLPGIRQNILIFAMGITNGIALVLTVIEMLSIHTGLVNERHLTLYGSRLIINGSAVLVLLIFIMKLFLSNQLNHIDE